MPKKLKHSVFPVFFTLVILIIPNSVLAHTGAIGPAGSFLSGLTHPVLGIDHLLAMLCVGIVSAQIGGRAIWTVPATFVGVMAVGGLLGLFITGFSLVEAGIALSLIALGVAIAAERSVPIATAISFVGLFAVFHGYAHGSEIPLTAEPVLYAGGFLSGTAIIHIAGVLIGDISQHYETGKRILRIGGGLIAMIGIMFLTGLF